MPTKPLLRTLAALVAALASIAFANHVALEAQDQEVRGTTIVLDRVLLEQDGFVVVHATNADGLVLTPPLGVAHLPAGEHADVEIALDPDALAPYAYQDGGTIVPMLHVDADGDGMYAFPDGPDVPVTVDGAPVVTEIEWTLLPSLATLPQTLAGGGITVDTVIAAQDGFVVVHALDLEGEAVIAPPLGVAPVEAGVTRFVGIDLDADLLQANGYDQGPKAVVPMLHVDADGDGAYAFPDGPDVPVTADGGALVAPLELSMPRMGRASVATGEGVLEVDADGLFVTLPSVTLTQPGFVVLHATEADGGLRVLPVLGASPALSAGTHQDVTVRIDADQAPVVGDAVAAMVHVDDGDGAYRFPASDAPFVQDGGPLVEPFTLN